MLWNKTIRIPKFGMLIACFACYLSLLMSGMCLSWTEPLTNSLRSSTVGVPLTEQQVSYVVSIVEVGACISPIPTGLLVDRIGRRWTLILSGVLALLGWVQAILFRSFESLCVSRVLSGLSLGSATTVAPMYIAELAPSSVRGALAGQLATMFTLGQLFIYATGHFLPYDRYIGVCAAVPAIFIVVQAFAPESPHFLISRGKEDEAADSLRRIRKTFDANEVEAISTNIKDIDVSSTRRWTKLFEWNYLKMLIVLQIICFISHMNGTQVMALYATETFGGRVWLTIGMGVLLAASSFIAAFTTDPFGRRPLLLLSLAGSAIFTALMALHFLLHNDYLLFVAVPGFSVVSSIGVIPICMTLQGELFPTSVRGLSSGITEFTLSFSSFLSLVTYNPINDAWGYHVNFILYTVISVIGVFVVTFFLPETSKTDIDPKISNINKV